MYNLGNYIHQDNDYVKIEVKIKRFIVDSDGQLVVLYNVVTTDKITNRQLSPVTIDLTVTDTSYRVKVFDSEGVDTGTTIGNFDFLYRALFQPFLKDTLVSAMIADYTKQENPIIYQLPHIEE